jgi:hypothetical protein
VAGALREAGRQEEAVELYRSVAIAYRDQGRSQQAIAVCRSILEIAPEDARCHALLATLVAGHKSATQPSPSPGLGPDVLEVGAPAERPRTPTTPGTIGTPGTSGTSGTPAPSPEAARVRIGAAIVGGPAAPEGQRPRTPTAQGMPPPAQVPPPPLASPQPVPVTAAPIPSLAGAGAAPPVAPAAASEPEPEESIADGVPNRISTYDETPLPTPLPYHIADPTKRMKKITDLPLAEGAVTRPGSEDGSLPEVSGIANAARRISATLIAASRPPDDDDPVVEVDTRQLPRVELEIDDEVLAVPSLGDDSLTPFPVGAADVGDAGADADDDGADGPAARDSDDAVTFPRGLPRGMRRKLPLRAPTHDDDDAVPAHAKPSIASGPAPAPASAAASAAPASSSPERSTPAALSFPFFAPLPADRRSVVLARFSRRSMPAGATVIRQGEQGHPLVLVASGRLEVHADRPAGEGKDPIELVPIGPGEYIGEAALLARGPAPAHVVAATEVELLLLAPRDFYEIAGAYPALWAQLKESAERRTRELAARLAK